MKLALVADWLTTLGGAERVIAEFHALWPAAPIFTTIARRGALGLLEDSDIRTTRLQRWYQIIRRHQLLFPWMPCAIESIDLRGFDLIHSSSHAVAKGIIPPSRAVHVCYCHTPMRYAWEMEEEYLEDFRIPRILRPWIRNRLKALRRWDLTTAKRVDLFIANSRTTQERIARTYARESLVIHPPVDDRFFGIQPQDPHGRSFYLAVGRLVPYKRFDLLIEVANAKKLPLKIAGSGQDEKRLRKMAGPTVEILGYVPEDGLPQLYGGAKALLFTAFEDAGVAPLEAQACGTPVIAFGKGGARDTVREGETGLFFEEQTAAALFAALERFQEMRFDPATIRGHARQFSSARFREQILDATKMAIATPKP